MEAITGLVLILLSCVGARNIPGHTDQPSEWPLEFDGPSGYKKTPLATIFPDGEQVESVVDVADLGLHLNTNNDKFEEHVNKDLGNEIIEDMDIYKSASFKKKKVNKTNKKDEADDVVRPVEVFKEQKKQKSKKALFEFREALVGGCPAGQIRAGSICLVVDNGD